MGSRVYSAGALIEYSVGGGWGKEEPQGDYQYEVAVVRGADFPSIEQGVYTELPIRWEKKTKATKSALQPGDIILEISGGTDDRPTGRTLYITEELLNSYACPVIPASFCRLLRPTHNIDSAYLFFWLQNMYNKGRTWGYQNRSTGLSNFQYKVFAELEQVEVPELKDQHSIANILLTLEEKRHLNNRANDYLEALGGALVERYIASCDGAIPLKALLDLGNGFAFKSRTYVDNGKYKVLTIKNVQDGNVDCSGANRIDEIPGRMKDFCRLNLGDAVLSLTGNVGRVGIVSEPDCVLNQRVAVFLPNAEHSLAGLYFWFRQDAFKDRMIGIARGTAQANLSPIETLQLEIPFNEDGFAELCEDAQPLYDAILANKTEMMALTSLRDALLPKLMSGEIDVSQIELPTQPNNHLSAD